MTTATQTRPTPIRALKADLDQVPAKEITKLSKAYRVIFDRYNEFLAKVSVQRTIRETCYQIARASQTESDVRAQLTEMMEQFTGQDWMDERIQSKTEFLETVQLQQMSLVEDVAALLQVHKDLIGEDYGDHPVPRVSGNGTDRAKTAAAHAAMKALGKRRIGSTPTEVEAPDTVQ